MHGLEGSEAYVEEGEDVGDNREMDRGQITWSLRCQGKRVCVLLPGHRRPLGLNSAVASCYSRSSPMSMSYLTGPSRIDSRNTLHAG